MQELGSQVLLLRSRFETAFAQLQKQRQCFGEKMTSQKSSLELSDGIIHLISLLFYKFADYFELRDIVVSRQDDFARGFTEHLIEYALGRPFGFTDEDFAEEVVHSARIKDYAVSEFVHAVVQSKAFQSK